jgi:hypothetical protein
VGSFEDRQVEPAILIVPINSAGGFVGLNASAWGLDRNMTTPIAVNYVVGVEDELQAKFVAGASCRIEDLQRSCRY